MSNTEFNATNGEQNSVQTLTSDNVAQENAVQSEPQKPLKLSEFTQREGLKLENGKYKPTNKQFKNKQLKGLVNCIDDDTNELISLAKIDTSEITSMKELFANSKRTNFKGIKEWDTSKVKTFELMFLNTEFNENISGWNVSSGRNFQSMFQRATQFNQPIGAEWNTSSATNMIGMFRFAINFNNGGAEFGEKWKMDKVEWTWEMFWGAEKFNQPLNHWNMSSVTKCYKMFMNAKAFNQPLDEWDLSNAVDLSKMFNKAEKFNQDLSAWGNKLSKAQNMERMFADTKSLTINFLGAWETQGRNTDNITKGSKLESGDKSEIKVIVASATRKSVFDECKISQIQKNKDINLKENKEFVGKWIPQNILENDYKVFLAKIKDFDDSEVDKSKFSLADLEQGSYEKWDFAFYKVFDCWFLVEKDGKELNDIQREGNPFKIEQSTDMELIEWDENDKTKACTYDNNLSILFDSKEISILVTNSADKTIDILAVMNAYILAKAYNAKMQELGTTARMANEERRKNKENKGLFSWIPFSKTKRTNKKLYKNLKKSYEFVCNFDLHSYHNIPIVQNELDDRSLVDIWKQISKTYMIQDKHDELKETIKQVTQLVSDERQEDLNSIMRLVAWLSAFAAAYPVIKDICLWFVSKLQ